MNCERARSLISASAIITACDVVRNDRLRLQTTFEFPGNEFVDLFVLPQVPADAPLVLTDGGMTIGQLLGFGLDVDATERRRQFVRSVCEQLGVHRQGGELTTTVREPSDANFGSAAVRLGQACVRIADLIITHRTRLASTFAEEMEEAFDALHVPVEEWVPLMGNRGREIRVDYVLRAPRTPVALFGLSARSQASARERVNATFRKWYELDPQRVDYQFVTLLDSRVPFWGEADRGVLEDVSEVFDYPAEADAFRELVMNE